MALTAQERLRKHREKLKQDPVKYALYLEKQRAYVAAKRKKVAEMSKREHQRAKKMWRDSKKKQRAKEKLSNYRPLSPPAEHDSSSPHVEPSGNRRRGRRVILKNRSGCVRENCKLKKIIADNQELIKKLQTKCEKYRKRSYRLEKSVEVSQTNNSLLLTPHTAAKKELSEIIPKNITSIERKKILSSGVAKNLTFYNVMGECFQQATPKHKKIISDVLIDSLALRYRRFFEKGVGGLN